MLVHDVGIAQALALKRKIAEVGVRSVMWLDSVVGVTVPLEDGQPPPSDITIAMALPLFRSTVAEGSRSTAVPRCAYSWTGGPGNAVSGETADTAQTTASVEGAGGAALIVPVIILLLVAVPPRRWIEPLLFIAAIGVSILINMGTNIVLGQVSFIHVLGEPHPAVGGVAGLRHLPATRSRPRRQRTPDDGATAMAGYAQVAVHHRRQRRHHAVRFRRSCVHTVQNPKPILASTW